MQLIPTSALPNQEFTIVLDDQDCTIGLKWMQRRLYLTLFVGDVRIASNLICENRVNILQRRLLGFNGTLHFWDTDGYRPPVWDGLNTRYLLYFVSAVEALPDILRY